MMLTCGVVQIQLTLGVPGLSVLVVSTALPVSRAYISWGHFHALPLSTHFPCLACSFLVTVFLSALIGTVHIKSHHWGLQTENGDLQQTGRSDGVDRYLPLFSQSGLLKYICKRVSGAAVETHRLGGRLGRFRFPFRWRNCGTD